MDMDKIKIHMIGNTHIDPVWLWNRAEGMQEVKSSFTSALDRMEEFPDFIFTQSCSSFLEWMKDNCPEEFERIKERVQEGRWEIVGGMWVEPDCDLPSGESLIRHFLYGKKFVRENFGKDVTTAYNVDSFGHGSNMPAICNGCGIKYYLMSRPNRNVVELPPVFIWKSKDGSQVIAERTGGEYMAWTRPALEFNLKESLELLEEYGYDRMAVFYGVGNHGGGPTIENIRTIYEMREEYENLSINFSTMEEFFTKVETDKVPERIQEMGRIFYGCYSSDQRIKELNRMAEWTLLKAEALSCMAVNMGVPAYRYPGEDITRAWKETLFNQFHDVLAGTSIEPARLEACQELAGAIATGRKIVCNGVQAMVNHMDTRGDGFPLILINPTSSDYHGVFCGDVYCPRAEKKPLRIRDSKGREITCAETAYRLSTRESRKGILFEANVAAYGYAVYRVITEGPDRGEEVSTITANQHILENGELKVAFDPETGAPSSIIKDGKELLRDSCSIAVYYDDRGAWGETVYQEEEKGHFQVTGHKIVEANNMRGIVRYLLSYGQSEMVIDYMLEKDSDRLKMEARIRNGEKHRQICLTIPVMGEQPQVWTETAFLAENRVDHENENKEYYQHRFADITDQQGRGIAVINRSSYGFRQVDHVYKLILLRNTIYARGAGGPMAEEPDEGYMNQASFDYQMVLIPHTEPVTKGRLFEEADFLHMPIEYIGDSNHKGAVHKRIGGLLEYEAHNVRISIVKQEEEGTGQILRMFEMEGEGGSISLSMSGKKISLTLTPYEIKTLRLTKKGFSECSMLELE